MMRVTNSMIVKRSKTNINSNRAKVDHTNNQMSTQKKITKPSDNPLIAIRSLRLRSSLSTITQYYENNIPDTQAWMEVTETALNNMKDIVSNAYEQVVYGSTDELNTENRQTILKELQSLQEQIYCEGNSDYAGRTVFTGYKTNQTLTFTNADEAKNAEYKNIVERFTYKDIEQKKYYIAGFDETDMDLAKIPDVFEELTLNRVRLAYDNVADNGQNALVITHKSGDYTVETALMPDGSTQTSVDGFTFLVDEDTAAAPGTSVAGITLTSPAGYIIDPASIVQPTVPEMTETTTDGTITTTVETYKYELKIYEDSNWDFDNDVPIDSAKVKTIPLYVDKTTVNDPSASPSTSVSYSQPLILNGQKISYTVTDKDNPMTDADYLAVANTEGANIVFDTARGELVFNDTVATALDAGKASFTVTYDKKGFDKGELKPEHYFDCTKVTATGNIEYRDNYDAEGNWIPEAIYYNIAGGQQMQINSEARDVFDSDIRRDMDDLIEIVQTAIKAQETVDSIEAKIKSGEYDDKLDELNKWLDAAKTQRDYANQNMHDTYKHYITKFQGYLDTVTLEITDLGGRGARVELTENRMSIQQSTFKDLKSSNEDMDLSELVINYSAASVAYQAALQAAAKIGKMTLLDYI